MVPMEALAWNFVKSLMKNLKLLLPLTMAVENLEKRKKSGIEENGGGNWRKEIKIFEFLFLVFNWISKWQFLIGNNGPLLSITCSAKRRKDYGFLGAEILPRFACWLSGSSFSRFSAPVGARFRKHTIYTYQNTQNEALSVVQRLVLSNH